VTNRYLTALVGKERDESSKITGHHNITEQQDDIVCFHTQKENKHKTAT
jgi:hypothetical protein